MWLSFQLLYSPGSFMAGVGFSFFYGFVGTFASGHGLGNIYPITAGLSLINYQNGEITAYNKVLSTGILFLMFAASNVMVLFSKNKVPTAKANKKVNSEAKRKDRVLKAENMR